MKLLPAILIALLLPAAHAEEQYVIRRAVEAGQLKPLAEILAGVQKTHPGKVLDVDLERDLAGRRIYEVTVLRNDGQRAKLLVDAVSGRELPHTATATPRLDMAKALRALLARHPGKVLELELKLTADNRLIYEVQLILQDGQLREFVIDAQNGEVLDGNGHRQEVLKKLMPLPACSVACRPATAAPSTRSNWNTIRTAAISTRSKSVSMTAASSNSTSMRSAASCSTTRKSADEGAAGRG